MPYCGEYFDVIGYEEFIKDIDKKIKSLNKERIELCHGRSIAKRAIFEHYKNGDTDIDGKVLPD